MKPEWELELMPLILGIMIKDYMLRSSRDEGRG